MIKHIWTVLCRKSILDQESNNISLLDVVERLQVKLSIKREGQKPDGFVISTEFEIVSFWIRDKIDKEEKIQISIETLDSEDNKLGEFTRDLTFSPKMKKMRLRVKMLNIKLTESGLYHFRIKSKASKQAKWKTEAEIPLEVELIKTLNKKRPILEA